jgi:hypothetical protein
VALVGDIRRRTTSRVRECACTGLARKDRTSARWWCVRASRRWHSRGDGTMPTTCTRQRDINRVTASGEVRTTRVCAHTTPGPRKAGPSLDGGVFSVWVPTASRNSACARRNKGTTPLQGKGARAATTAAAPAKRPARLDDRLSSDGGSARWRERAAGNTQTTSPPGSVQPRLEGRVHNKVEGETHLAFLDTTARRRRRGAAAKRTQSRGCRTGLAWFGLGQANITVKRKQTGAASFLVVPAPASRRQQLPRTMMETRPQAHSQG